MKIRNFELKIARENYKSWHEKNEGYELHHGLLKVGWRVACFNTYRKAYPGHQCDYEWVEKIREELNWMNRAMEKQYVRGEGCICGFLTENCNKCFMPKIGINPKRVKNY